MEWITILADGAYNQSTGRAAIALVAKDQAGIKILEKAKPVNAAWLFTRKCLHVWKQSCWLTNTTGRTYPYLRILYY